MLFATNRRTSNKISGKHQKIMAYFRFANNVVTAGNGDAPCPPSDRNSGFGHSREGINLVEVLESEDSIGEPLDAETGAGAGD